MAYDKKSAEPEDKILLELTILAAQGFWPIGVNRLIA
jgi:hypothetical protein